jgi:HlyD family secretion protein
MPAEVYIKTAERTFFQYIVRPIHDSMMRAFRER